MADPRRAVSKRLTTLFVAALLIGCAGGVQPLPPAPAPVAVLAEPLTPSEIDAIGELLRLEDRREWMPAIPEASASPNAAIRARAALSVARVPSPESNRIIGNLLGDADSAVIAAAAFSAGLLRDSAAIGPLVRILDVSYAASAPSVAVEAAAALGRLALPESRAALAAFLNAADSSDVRLNPVVAEALIASWRAGETSAEPYARWLRSPDPEIRWRAAYALIRRPRPEAVPLLLPLLDDPDPVARSFAIRGLAQPLVSSALGSTASVLPRLLEAVADSNYVVRIEAIRALGTYRDRSSVGALEASAVNGAPHDAIAALEALARIGADGAGSSLASLLQLASNPQTPITVREVAVTAAATIDSTNAISVLDLLSADPAWRIRSAVARSASRFRSDGLPILQRLARDIDPRVAAAAIDAAIEAVGASSIHSIRPLLFEQLENSDTQVRAAAFRGFTLLSDPSAFPALLDAFDRSQYDRENEAALAGIDAIADLGTTGQLSPERAFFARFQRPDDHLIRLKAVARFQEAAAVAWGNHLPIETHTLPGQYRGYVERWLAPSPHLRPLPRVRIETDLGTIEALLFADQAPITVVNFLSLAAAGFFDAQEWPRVVPNFVVQGGDPRGDTSGGPGYTIRDELNRARFGVGTLGMALSGPDTGGSQFFITHSPQPHLDGGYTVFGRVFAGMDVLERLLPGNRILSIREILIDEPL